MKSYLYALLLMSLLSFSSLMAASSPPPRLRLQAGSKHELKHWSLSAVGDSAQYAVQAPSVVQAELIKYGKLPDPYYRNNEPLVQWVSEQDWVYTTEFELEAEALHTPHMHHILECEGLDTYADIYVNGQHITHTDNMFRLYHLDISRALRQGRNRISIHFHSPTRYAMGQYLSNGFNYPADNDHAQIRLSPFTRKAPYHYGWDWGMRLLSMGIYRPIHLASYRQAHLENLDIRTSIHWSADAKTALSAEISVHPELVQWHSDANLRLRARLLDDQGQVVSQTYSTSLSRPAVLRLDRPKLWWPNGWGKPYLYQLVVAVEDQQGQSLQTLSKRIGIREVELVNQPDEHGTSFYFQVNGMPLFARGANYVPSHTILTQRSHKELRQLFEDAVFAHFNMLRVWGGGVYEEDAFYDLADEYGILIWQDFMFACTAYPSDDAFLHSVEQEAKDQIRRLRHHPSIALWCGNNEVEEALKYWGWQRKYPQQIYQQMYDGYAPLFRELLDRSVRQYDPQRSYIHSSPMQANWGRKESFLHGDIHYWGLWYGKQGFDAFQEHPMRFVSEFGFQSFPSMSSIARFATTEDYSLESTVMTLHQKASTGNGLIREYMAREYRVPERFEDFVYTSQVLQARGMAQAVRAQRRHKPICMGALYWQFNDAWPAVSWSSVDYYGEYKAMHYAMREAYAPQCLTIEQDSVTKVLNVHLLNDALAPYSIDTLQLQTYDLSTGRKLSQSIPIHRTAQAGATLALHQIDLKQLMGAEDIADVLLSLTHKPQQGVALRAEWASTATKNLELPKPKYELRIRFAEKGRTVFTLRALSLLKDVMLYLPWTGARFSDNLFDLYPDQERYIEVRHPNISAQGALSIEVRTMNDVHQHTAQ